MVVVWRHPYRESRELAVLVEILAVFGITAEYEQVGEGPLVLSRQMLLPTLVQLFVPTLIKYLPSASKQSAKQLVFYEFGLVSGARVRVTSIGKLLEYTGDNAYIKNCDKNVVNLIQCGDDECDELVVKYFTNLVQELPILGQIGRFLFATRTFQTLLVYVGLICLLMLIMLGVWLAVKMAGCK